MSLIEEWAAKWGVSQAAIADLYGSLPDQPAPKRCKVGTEDAAQQAIRVEASKKGMRLWRNNVGACQDHTGRFIRYGLANDSKKLIR